MKFLQQLFGGNGLSWFGRSKSKASTTAAAAKTSQNNSESTEIHPETVNKPDVACSSPVSRQSVADTKPDVTENCFQDFDGAEVESECWSPAANRICWGSPVARRSASRRGATESGEEIRSKLPRSRSMIRTNPWLPPSSPPPDRRLGGLGRSPSPESGSASCPPTQPPTPGDSPAVGDPGRRWRLAEPQGPATAASEGYCSVSSLCTMSDIGGTMSTAAVSDLMQISVDSLASLFPTTMSASSTSSLHDDKISGTGCGAFSDSVVDSGIVVSSTPVDQNSTSTISDAEAEQSEDPDAAAEVDPPSSDCGTPTNQVQTSSPAASAALLSKHLSALRSTIDRHDATDYDFDPDVFPFGTAETGQRRPPKLARSPGSSSSPPPPPPRAVDEISSSLASSVERLRRGCAAVDGAFGRALAEDRRRERELARLRRRVIEAQRDVLLGTLNDLRRELDDQCRRLQAAYDAVLTARWPRLHAGTAYAACPTVTGHRLPYQTVPQPQPQSTF